MKMILAVMMATLTAVGQSFFTSRDTVADAKEAKYVLVMAARVVDPSVSYAVVCSPNRPYCNTVYKLEARYIPFKTLDEAITYLNASEDTFIGLEELRSVAVHVDTVKNSVHHPDTEETHTRYSAPAK